MRLVCILDKDASPRSSLRWVYHPQSEGASMPTIREELAALADPAYRDFQARLVPTVEAGRILGVRTPALRRYARELARRRPDEARAFVGAHLPHATYDEMNLHAELIGLLARTPEEAFCLLEAFLPHVDNWATCDLIRVGALGRDLDATLERIRSWVAPESPEYVVRFGVTTLMTLFLGDAFEPSQLQLVADIDRPEYYVNMARAWYFSYALIRQGEATLPLFEARPPRLDAWTHNKSLQKARESRRVTPEQRAYLQSLKVRA